ncbi:hypothetical protein [Cohnella kolymensis]|uniref:hypothetical protein n=1 Tax=Cohnella kolymensis TaxID=1590652 RepID=UPI000696477E|nr:hypothetical protein [Cohnella kolymensis]
MGITVTIETKRLTFKKEELERWKSGDREDCPDGYCKRLPNSYGFGEYVVGRHFQRQGYLWIHHDFNLFGYNKPGKYPLAEEVLIRCIGKDEYENMRKLFHMFKPLEEPDLLIYKPDFSEIRFAESKRRDTGDKLREAQIIGLSLISLMLKCEVQIFEVVEEGKQQPPAANVTWSF